MNAIATNLSFPQWLTKIFAIESINETDYLLNDSAFEMKEGILRHKGILSENQKQTENTFDFKWKKRDTFESSNSLKRTHDWLKERYGEPSEFPWLKKMSNPILLDAGCGSGLSGIEYWKAHFHHVHYLGVDVSASVEVAKDRLKKSGFPGYFLQCGLMELPLPEKSVDIIFSEGVLHHTDSTEKSLKRLAKFLKKDGRFMFYIYRQKGPIREFTDDYLRDKLKALPQQEAWEALMPLTKLGKVLGELNIELDIPEAISILDIPAGKINLQRFLYWHVFKAFYHENLTLEEMNHINFDWYAPSNASRHTVEEVHRWCKEANLDIERLIEEPAGFTVVAKAIA